MPNRYIEHIRAINRIKTAYCYICKDKPAFGIISEGYRIEYVCKTHYLLDQDLRERMED